jgi:hypothetical protein
VKVVVADRHAAPTIVGAPKLEAARLTPAVTNPPVVDIPDDPRRPVHRFTVSGVTWKVPGATGDLAEVALQLPVAEGSVDGSSWHPLGTLASPLTPSIDGDRITMGEAVFDWQNASDAPREYRYFRVTAGGANSNVIDVTPLPAPAPTSRVGSMLIVGAGTSRGNGLDQAPMRVSLRDLSGDKQALDATEHAELYARIYYRDAGTQALITGLGDPTDPNRLVMFSLEPGQYANEGLVIDGTPSIGVYFSARQSQNRQIRAVLKPDGAGVGLVAENFSLRPAASALLSMGTAANGLSVGSCPESECALALADPWEAPALHSLRVSTVGVQLRTVAVPGAASLPLAYPNQLPEELRLVSDTFLYHGPRAMLENPNRFTYNAMITTDLVAQGERVIAENHWVRAK